MKQSNILLFISNDAMGGTESRKNIEIIFEKF